MLFDLDVYKAIQFATLKHKGQYRKVSGLPYISHPLEVFKLVTRYKPNSRKLKHLQIASILHDTLEDTDTTFEEIALEFGPLVASLVFELTSDETLVKEMSKLEYLKRKMMGMSSYGLVVKLCDRLSNVMDHPSDKSKHETREILSFLKTERKLSGTHLQIISQIECYV